VVIAIAWALTVLTANDLMMLLGEQVSGAAPVDRLLFAGLVGIMMVAMMLPSAIPMLVTVRQVTVPSVGRAEGNLRAALFGLSYFVLWTAVSALALVFLMGLGIIGVGSFPLSLLPGGILIAAGAYQFSAGKRYCLSKCRTPLGFVMTHWRGGRRGAVRMGLDHSLYCLGCCWLLMAVVFVTGAMSLLWMGVFSGLILTEKVWERGEWFSQVLGGGAVVVGAGLIALASFLG
jgi:predicted metal-binding membrane protein